MRDIKAMLPEEIAAALAEMGQPKYRAKQIFQWLARGVTSFDEMTNLSKDLRAALSERFSISKLEMLRKQVSAIDGTIKYLWQLSDGNAVETVVMHYKHGNTVCISSQVGCRQGCAFCASTIGGLIRNLEPSEMLDEVLYSERESGSKISNIVLMGIGEPLDNFDNVMRFLELVNHPDGENIGMRHISLSTCGLIERFDDLAARDLQLTLSVSLHAPDDATRSKIMPANHGRGVAALIDACARYYETTGRRISFEYAMIDGVNDTPEHARAAGQSTRGASARTSTSSRSTTWKSARSGRPRRSISRHSSAFWSRRASMSPCAASSAAMWMHRAASCAKRSPIIEPEGGEPMHCFAQSDRGSVRKENQDRAACAHIRRKGCTIAVVCDGMGGAAGGKLASDLAASMFLADFRREMQAGIAVEPAMRHACDAANRAVYDRACADPDLHGMGTTIVAACVRHGRLTVLHVGDSRAYLAGLRRMQQLTTDHSLVQELVASGQVLPEQAHRHPRRNVITRAVGVGPKVEPDCRTLPFPLGARLLLCTDGLSNTLSEGQMHDLCRSSRDAKQICSRLIAAALARGARDNVTALVLFR